MSLYARIHGTKPPDTTTPDSGRLGPSEAPVEPEWLRRAKAEANGRRWVARKDETGRAA